ncbi:FAD-dependent thymidylate synthase [Planktotalea sp.]|uniref:FAD-dependent thymidylate synthase n=1 Tax=Planktotalea sp. TaxID=2029877 RepID=UPI00329A7B3F
MAQPRIYVLSRPSFENSELQRFLQDRELAWVESSGASEGEHLVEVCGRICYMSFSDDTSKMRYPNDVYIENLVKKGHESVLEHANWTFILDGISRAFTHQLVRHRIGFSFSQLSQQYHDESKANVVPPEGLQSEVKELWEASTSETIKAYRRIVELTDANKAIDLETKRRLRSEARSLLPNAVETVIAVTANARSIRHFLNLRGSLIGDIEMRQVSVAIYHMVTGDARALFSDFEIVDHSDGYPLVSHRRES